MPPAQGLASRPPTSRARAGATLRSPAPGSASRALQDARAPGQVSSQCPVHRSRGVSAQRVTGGGREEFVVRVMLHLVSHEDFVVRVMPEGHGIHSDDPQPAGDLAGDEEPWRATGIGYSGPRGSVQAIPGLVDLCRLFWALWIGAGYSGWIGARYSGLRGSVHAIPSQVSRVGKSPTREGQFPHVAPEALARTVKPTLHGSAAHASLSWKSATRGDCPTSAASASGSHVLSRCAVAAECARACRRGAASARRDI
eukprot:scaffold8659_cov129-Isochrysis_galbana.AAC.3